MMKAVNAEILELVLITTIADVQEHRTDEAVAILKSTLDMIHECKSIGDYLKGLKDKQLLATLNQLFPASTPEGTGDPSQTSPHS